MWRICLTAAPGLHRQLLSILLAALLACATTAHAQQKPRRVASLNLCTDQLLLTLADRAQIASLSRLATDPTISFMAEQAAGLPMNDGTAETVLFSDADLVLTGTNGPQHQVSLLRGQGLEVLTLGSWATIAEGREQIRTLARRLGYPERGEALIARIDEALEQTKDIVPNRRSILVYDRGGWVMASNSLIGELLRHMGFTLHQDALGLAQGGVPQLETIVASPPDFMLVDENTDRAVDNGTALFVHPALKAAVPASRRLRIPGRLTICGGPSTPAAIDALAQEVRTRMQ